VNEQEIQMRQVLVVVGTRSEMVRLAPVIRRLRDEGGRAVGVRWIHADDHVGQIWQTAAVFGLSSDGEVPSGHSPSNLLEHSWAFTKEMECRMPDLLVVQGESLLAMLAAQQAFMRRVPVIYLVASSHNGLRDSKGPQNSYRKLLTAISTFQCVTNEADLMQLRAHGVPAFEIGITGDTVVDAIDTVTKYGVLNGSKAVRGPENGRAATQILVPLGTSARWVGSLTDFALAIADLAQSASRYEFTIVLESDAVCRDLMSAILGSTPNVTLRDPMQYSEFLRLMQQQDVVLADGLDYYDEAVALRKPMLLAQDRASDQDFAPPTGLTLIGSRREQIVQAVLDSRRANGQVKRQPSSIHSLGDGHAASRILRLIMNWSRNQILTPRAFEPYRS
jgi:UDP-N-acetylglucosamine 2-epimerase (non-hydrolysing)